MNAFLKVNAIAERSFCDRIGEWAASDFFRVSERFLCFPMFTRPGNRHVEANVAVLAGGSLEDCKYIRHTLFGGRGFHTGHNLVKDGPAAYVFAKAGYPGGFTMYYWTLDETDFRSVLSCTEWISGEWSSLVIKHGETKAFGIYEKALRSFVEAGRDVGDEFDIDEDNPF